MYVEYTKLFKKKKKIVYVECIEYVHSFKN